MHFKNAIASMAMASIVLATPIDVHRRADDCGGFHPVVQTIWVKNDPVDASPNNDPAGVQPAASAIQTSLASVVQTIQDPSRKSTVPPTLLDTTTAAATAAANLQTITSTSTMTSFVVGSTTVSGKASQVTSTILSTRVITITITPSAPSSGRPSVQPGAVTQDAVTVKVPGSSAVAVTLKSPLTTVVNGGTTITFLSTLTTAVGAASNTQKVQAAPTFISAGSSQIPPYGTGNRSTTATSNRASPSVTTSATRSDIASTHLTLTQATSTLAVATTKPTTSLQTADQTSTLASAVASSIVATATPSALPHANANDAVFQSNFTAAHNNYRRVHHAPDVTWDADLANSALIQGEGCVWAHNTSINGGGYGQNIYAITSGGGGDFILPQLPVDSWYNEVVDYHSYGLPNPTNDTPGKVTGHFTQVVWIASTRLGCATVRCPSLKGAFNVQSDYVVCNYKTPGNFGGQYAVNVKAP